MLPEVSQVFGLCVLFEQIGTAEVPGGGIAQPTRPRMTGFWGNSRPNGR